jgi:hypothetical protein
MDGNSVNRGLMECVDQMKQAKLQWLQDRSSVNADNPNNVRHEAGRHSRNRRGTI